MEIPEFNRHRIHAQLLKIIAHIHKARHDLTLCEEHYHVVRNAGKIDGIATLQLDFSSLPSWIESECDKMTEIIGMLTVWANLIEQAMTHPHDSAPPLVGKHIQIDNRTPLQRTLIREGHMPHSDVPTHFCQVPINQNRKPPTPLPIPPKQKLTPRKKKRKDMPL